jgi:hypothetical protein
MMKIYMKINQKKPQYSSFVKDGDNIWEMVYEPENKATYFCGNHNSQTVLLPSVEKNKQAILPYPADNKLVSNKVILFPSKAEEFGSENDLLLEIQEFIHKYLEVSEFFEQITPFYILLTWVYDSFKELPYLRAIGDYGCGKSRFLKVVGSICYKPAFTAGATNPAPIFRIIDQFKGTLVIDEADMRFSDTNSEIVKILNNGFQAGMPVLRCASGEKNYEVEAYDVFGPKIVATRERYEDKALESRFIVEHMDGRLTRSDIPLNLDDDFELEALSIRNKCLMWRLQNYGKMTLDTSFKDIAVEPRLIQVMTPLVSVIKDEQIKKNLVSYIEKHNLELINDRGLSYEAPILRIIISLVENGGEDITMESIATSYNMGLVRGEKELSGRKVGKIVREKFGFKTDRKNIGYVLDLQNYRSKIDRLKKKYGLESELSELGALCGGGETEIHKELEQMGLIEPELPKF